MYAELKRGKHDTFALTDINNTSACMYTLKDASLYGIHPAIGVDFRNGPSQQYVALAKNAEGFKAINEHLNFHLHHELPFPKVAPRFEHVFIVYPFEQFAAPFELKEHEYIGIRPNQLSQLMRSEWRNYSNKLVVLQTASFRNKKDYFDTHNINAVSKSVFHGCRELDTCVLRSAQP